MIDAELHITYQRLKSGWRHDLLLDLKDNACTTPLWFTFTNHWQKIIGSECLKGNISLTGTTIHVQHSETSEPHTLLLKLVYLTRAFFQSFCVCCEFQISNGRILWVLRITWVLHWDASILYSYTSFDVDMTCTHVSNQSVHQSTLVTLDLQKAAKCLLSTWGAHVEQIYFSASQLDREKMRYC